MSHLPSPVPAVDDVARAPAQPRRSFWDRSVVGALARHKLGRIGLALAVFMALVALLAPLLAPYDPAFQDPDLELSGPSIPHWLGTDQFGRDILSRVIFGTRVAFLIGGTAALFGMVIGVTIGLFAGFYGGWSEGVLMRGVDVVLAFPGVLLALLLVTMLRPGVFSVAVALAVASVPIFARLARANALQLKTREYVLAAKLFGASGPRTIATHLLRNCASPIVVQFSLTMGISVLTESALSFLGLGIQPPTASWGLMLSESRPFLADAPWFALAPGIALTLFLLALVLLSDALRDVLDVGETVEVAP